MANRKCCRCCTLTRCLLVQFVMSVWLVLLAVALVFRYAQISNALRTKYNMAAIDLYESYVNSAYVDVNETLSATLWSSFSRSDQQSPNSSAAAAAASDVRWVAIVTYQRCGSSFYGQLFNSNSKAFYLFEPIDAVYSALYGTKNGYNAPSNIYSYSNGTERLIPEVESSTVANSLANLLSCNVSNWSTSSLTHTYWTIISKEAHGAGASTYSRCLQTKMPKQNYRQCEKLNPYYCGQQFGEEPTGGDEQRLAICRSALNSQNFMTSPSTAVPDSNLLTRYRAYASCMEARRSELWAKCGQTLQQSCSSSKIRAAKTVRMTMSTVEPLLRAHPQFFVIHLMRDPRAVVASRQATNDISVIGRYARSARNGSDEEVVREAVIYCRRLADDIRTRRRLESLYPGRILSVRYEDIMSDGDNSLRRHADNVFRQFLGVGDPPRDTQHWIQRTLVARKRSADHGLKSPLNKWKCRLSDAQNEAIVRRACRDFFSLGVYDDLISAAAAVYNSMLGNASDVNVGR